MGVPWWRAGVLDRGPGVACLDDLLSRCAVPVASVVGTRPDATAPTSQFTTSEATICTSGSGEASPVLECRVQ